MQRKTGKSTEKKSAKKKHSYMLTKIAVLYVATGSLVKLAGMSHAIHPFWVDVADLILVASILMTVADMGLSTLGGVSALKTRKANNL